MRFKRSVQRYGRTPEPETPYQRAGQLWDERIGSARVQARNWRLMAFGGLALTSAMSAALVWQSLQSRVVPYVVEVDRLGEARAVTEAERDYRPSDAQIAWHLARFIEQVRSISTDPVLMRREWLAAYDFVTRRGGQFLGDYARSANPFGAIGEKTVSVQVTSVVRASERSFQVKWTETAFERGVQTGSSKWTAILTVVRRPPSSADAVRHNPLGLYIDAIDWSRELEPPASPGDAAVEGGADSAGGTAPADRDPAPASMRLIPENQP
ncbi:conjugal transfer protein TrbF [Sphingomonas cannabina]|uniref:conjugal transfer protein TrbF n=1 Tax=Sphingomonas cannabina TaxID=2899123 RepID=UPI001EEC2426|nr:conjugal transfer protein TrbF [Sphingomonas cannabina]UIJ46231.1 conjugal transfer protein TrbF [Sphingomonas cannabina]